MIIFHLPKFALMLLSFSLSTKVGQELSHFRIPLHPKRALIYRFKSVLLSSFVALFSLKRLSIAAVVLQQLLEDLLNMIGRKFCNTFAGLLAFTSPQKVVWHQGLGSKERRPPTHL